MAWGLNTESLLNVLTRFTSRKGVPMEMICDNGSNFVGAANELKELVDQLDKEMIQHMTANKGIKWKFNHPVGTHFGGVHEIMVKVTKKAIYAVLRAVISQMKNWSQSLPMLKVYLIQGSRLPTLVPFSRYWHPTIFFIGQMRGQFARESVDNMRFDPRKRWRKVQELIPRVWYR